MNFAALGNMSISRRLSVGFGVVVSLLAVLTAVSVVSMRDTRHRVLTINEQLRPKIDMASSVRPEPISPAMPTTSPARTAKEMSSITCRSACSGCQTFQFFTSSTVSPGFGLRSG